MRKISNWVPIVLIAISTQSKAQVGRALGQAADIESRRAKIVEAKKLVDDTAEMCNAIKEHEPKNTKDKEHKKLLVHLYACDVPLKSTEPKATSTK